MFKIFTKCFRCFSKCLRKKQSNVYTQDDYIGAGVLFTNGKNIIAGYQPNKKKPFISGIGGMRNKGETNYFETAIRETLEELYEIYSFPANLLQDIKEQMIPKKVIQTERYINIVFTFTDLQILMNLTKKYSIVSELYDVLPSNINEFIFNRKILSKRTEISHVCILPLIHNDANPQCIDPYFLSDLPQVMEISIDILQ